MFRVAQTTISDGVFPRASPTSTRLKCNPISRPREISRFSRTNQKLCTSLAHKISTHFSENIGLCIFKRTIFYHTSWYNETLLSGMSRRLPLSSSLVGPSRYAHSNRSEILLRSIKKKHRFFWKCQKLEIFFECAFLEGPTNKLERGKHLGRGVSLYQEVW